MSPVTAAASVALPKLWDRLRLIAHLLHDAPKGAAEPRLLWREPSGAVKVHTLQDRCLIGRSTDCDLRFNRSQVSRQHCEIRLAGRFDYILRDRGSANGTRVNGTPLTGEHLLHEGDCIELGSAVTLVFVGEPFLHA